MSETIEEVTSAPVLPGTPPAPAVTAAAAATEEPAAPPAAEEEEGKEKKPTEYVVLISNEEDGPYTKVGVFPGFGQAAAKKAAGEKLIADGVEGVAAFYFTASPTTSWSPTQPSGVKLQPQITF